MELLIFLEDILGKSNRYGNNEYYFNCPFCNHKNKKLAINLRKTAWHCWTCEAAGNNLFSFLKKMNLSDKTRELSALMGERPTEYINKVIPQDVISLPNEYTPLWSSNKSFLKIDAINYLQSRNISYEDIIAYQIGYCERGLYANRIIIPSYDADGDLNYFIARSVYESNRKYNNPPISKDIVLFEMYINWKEPIILCEGVFDAIAIKRNAIPLAGSVIQDYLKEQILLHRVKEIYICLDNDALKKTFKPIKYFMDQNITVYQVRLTEKDPSLIGFKDMNTILKNNRCPMDYKTLLEDKLSII